MRKMPCNREANLRKVQLSKYKLAISQHLPHFLAIPSQKPASSQEFHIDPDVRRDLELILERNLREIISKYASYVDCLRIAIIEKKVSVDDLRSYLLSLSATSQSFKGPTLTLLSDKETQLQNCGTVTDVFNLLTTRCASFLNYDIFEYIRKRYSILNTQKELEYPHHLEDYIRKHKISEFTKINPLLKTKNGSKELTLKYDIETTCTLAKIQDLKKSISQVLELSSSALEIVDIEEGCVIVTFLIPISVADALFKPEKVFTPRQEEGLRATSVLWLKCNGHTFPFGKPKFYNEGKKTCL